MRIGDIARELEVSTTWIRRLERKGLVPPAPRDRNGHRRYRPQHVRILRAALFGMSRKNGRRR